MPKRTSVPAVIVEDHDQVVGHLHSWFGGKRLPLFNLTMVHFDSHPDLLLPTSMPAETVFDRYGLQGALSIENWLLPLCYAGHVSAIAWIRPEWSTQIKDGIHTFQIGKHTESGTIRTSCKEMYFISELLYAPVEELESTKEVTLLVFSLKDSDITYIDKLKGMKLVIQRRREQLYELNRFFESIAKSEIVDFISELGSLISNKERRKLAVGLVDSVLRSYSDIKIDWTSIHEAGCTIDENGLPHHVSTRGDIANIYMPDVELFLKNLGYTPNAITIARSSDDDYCPKDDVDFIQDCVLGSLNGIYSAIDIKCAYKEQD
ncbi:UPF0489 protein C5orf22 homolog isoform X2 [Artemia franciscana]|uniref:UPF0489 protein C5orf22 homolog isoform X2 n=1 Tax=Artemia franciscana TaxID=6661 RepID=UPI0032DA5268